MGLRIANGYSAQLSVCIMFKSSDTCAGEGLGWDMRGWWNINPNNSAEVYGGILATVNSLWYYYAQATDGTTWAGNGTWTAAVPNEAFDQCYGIGVDPGREVDFRELDTGINWEYTLTLT